MCDLGMVIGLMSGIAQAQGQQETARKNRKMIRDQQRAEMAQKQREYIVEANAAVKEGGKAARERDRAVGLVNAMGEGMMGNTPGLRIAEQKAQGSLSIQAAKDRAAAGLYNYQQGTQIDAIETANKIAVNTPSKGAMFANIISSAVGGYGQFG